MEKLRTALARESLNLPKKEEALYRDLKSLNSRAYERMWHVYIKKTFKGAGQVVSYLGRYTHRVAISNSRILHADSRTVRFRWKDYRDNRTKTMEIGSGEFIRRFMRHILPTGFYKIRYYGIFSSANSQSKMKDCFILVGKRKAVSDYQGLGTYEVLLLICGDKIFRCPCCQEGKMVYTSPESTDREVP